MSYQQEHKAEVLSAVRRFAQSVNSGRKIVADMSMLVDATSNLSLTNLDFWERLIRWEFSRELKVSMPAKWKFWVRTTPFLTWIDLCSEDGFKRERTLRSLSGAAPNRFFFALAVRRLNDWVSQVREAAREKLPSIAKDTDPEYVVDVLCSAFPHWNSWGRIREKDRQVLVEIASMEKVSYSLKSRILSAVSGPMTLVLSQAGRSESVDRYLGEIARKAIQPSVRAKAYRCLLEGKMVWVAGRKWRWTDVRYCKGKFEPILCDRTIFDTTPFLETLKSAAMDSSPIVRRVAGEMLIRMPEKAGAESARLAERLASDSSPSVAERGRFALSKLMK